ncbi:MAG: hypothetical protein J6J35_03830 [Alphaproteobacteria bacterium]|nr:hypothetical protein [Alphaproteobacteria bacterium]
MERISVFEALGMLYFLRCWVLFLFMAGLSGCRASVEPFYDDVPVVEDEASNWSEVSSGEVKIEEDYENASKCCSSCGREQSSVLEKNSLVTVGGLKYCPPNKRCPDDGILPPQPCLQPMPEYYNNVSPLETAEGVVLIHPYTRAEVICYDDYGQTAAQCADTFKSEGYVLITDLPQLPARYDFLREGTYPTRRWRNGGEVVPRW